MWDCLISKCLSSRENVSYYMLFLVIILFGGCRTTPIHKPLDPGLFSEKKEVTVRAFIDQDTIYVPVKETRGAKRYVYGNGIIGSLLYAGEKKVQDSVNRKRHKTADERIAPLISISQDIDFPKDFMNALNKTVASSPWFVNKAEAPYYTLTLLPEYYLLKDYRVLVIHTEAELRKVGEPLPLYSGKFTYNSGSIGKESNDDAIAKWTANNAAEYRFALSHGIQETMKMLYLDLLDGHNENEEPNKVIIKGRNRILKRDKSGFLVSTSTTTLEYEHKQSSRQVSD